MNDPIQVVVRARWHNNTAEQIEYAREITDEELGVVLRALRERWTDAATFELLYGDAARAVSGYDMGMALVAAKAARESEEGEKGVDG